MIAQVGTATGVINVPFGCYLRSAKLTLRSGCSLAALWHGLWVQAASAEAAGINIRTASIACVLNWRVGPKFRTLSHQAAPCSGQLKR